MGITVVENDDGIEAIDMITNDVTKAVLSFEAPRCIADYLGKHNFKKTFEYVVSKLQSDDSRRLMKMMMEENKVSELSYRQALFNHRERYKLKVYQYFERNSLDAILYPTLSVLPCKLEEYHSNQKWKMSSGG